MKRALRKDFFREIRRNSGRFISIFCIIALGSAFYAGVRSAKYDMKYSADTYYDDVKMMDIRVLSTLGLTDEDLEDIRDVGGVESVTGGRTGEVLYEGDDTELVIRLTALTDDVNQPTVTAGRMPEKPDECLADTAFLDKSGCKIGDTVTYKSGTDDPLSDMLRRDTFTIVGAAKLPDYMDIGRGTGSVGDGSIDAFMLLEPEVFKSEVYTEAYVRVKGAEQLFCYDDPYEDKVKTVEDGLKDIEDAACRRRYEEIKSEAEDKLSDARQEIENGEKELSDARAELEGGQDKIAKAEQTLAGKAQELADAKAEAADGEARIQDGWGQIADGESQLKDGQAQLDEKKRELESSRQLLGQKQAEYETGLAQYQEQAANLEYLNAQIAMAKEKLPELESQVPDPDGTIQVLEGAIENLEQQISQLEEQKSRMEEEMAAAGDDGSDNEQYQYLCGQLEAMKQQLEQLKGQLAQVTEAKNAMEQLRQVIAMEPQAIEGQAQLAAAKEELDSGKQQLDDGFAQADQGEAQLAAAQEELDSRKSQLESSRRELEEREQELADARQELADGEQALEDGRKELEEKKQELEDAQKTFDEESGDAREKIDEAKEKVLDGEKELQDLKVPEWYILNREKISSYVSFDMDADRMGNIGKVFPVIFFLVAALVSLTAMTRMIEEQRTAIGTLKALGYSDWVIAMKYFSYAMLATVGGSILGAAVGSRILPWIIIRSYGMLYTGLPEYLTPLNKDQAALAVLASVASTGAATLVASFRELRAKPAELMRPEAPKSGRRVVLERIPFIWRHLNFTQKSTIRNLMRYKKRFFMTVIGIGGCMALMLVGFGLQDSITVVAQNQYTHIFTYDAAASVDTKASAGEKETLMELCDTYDGVDGYMKVHSQNVDLEYDGHSREDVTLEVPEDPGKIEDFVVFKDRTTGERYEFPGDGVILTEKTARMLHVSVGDTLTIQAEEKEEVKARVAVIAENYVLHYIYMGPDLYEKLFGEEPETNQIWLNYHFENNRERQDFGNRMMAQKACTGLSFISEKVDDIAYMLQTLNSVMYVLIISAGLLAFVVLYNLNSINITERKRELATLKVLGFFDGEVAAYVYRENVILTLIGIAAGVIMGIFLHQFVIQTVEVDAMMFGRVIRPWSFVISGVLSLAFSLLVNGLMYWRLKKIDMIESLKSVE